MITEVLRQAAHFRNLPEEALKRLARSLTEVELEAGASVYEAGEPADALFVVARGTVLIFHGQRGEESRPIARLQCGDLLGAADLFDSKRYSDTARALEESVVLRGAKDDWIEFLEDQPQLALNLRLAAARDLTARAKLALEDARREVRPRINRMVRLKPEGGGALTATLVDLSPFGMALRGPPESWVVEAVVEYRLEWGDCRLDLTGRVAWREGEHAGIELQEPSSELRQQIERMRDQMLRSQV